jgi:hypothetical protein
MQVLEILKKNGAELYLEDLAFFEAELDTGDYPLEYIDQCKDLIAEIRNQKKQAAKPKVQDVIPHNILVDPDKLVPGVKPKEKRHRKDWPISRMHFSRCARLQTIKLASSNISLIIRKLMKHSSIRTLQCFSRANWNPF